jgi:hypothetical protein
LRVTGSLIDVTDIENLRATAERAKATLDSALDAMEEASPCSTRTNVW